MSDRLEQVEALLAEERAKAVNRQTNNVAINASGDHDRPGEPQTMAYDQAPRDVATNEVRFSDVELALIERYFDHCNHVFPIFSQPTFLTSMLRHLFRDGQDEEGAAVRTSTNAMLVLALRMHAICETGNATPGEGQVTSYLERATAELSALVLAKPSLTTVQALLIIVCAMLASSDSTSKASAVLAVAVRQAQSLDLHLLDTLTGLSPVERMDRIRVFWCLYILDKDLGLRLCKPSLLSDDDLNVLSPRAVSDDRIGLLSSEDGELQFGMFAARQQLAKIQSAVYARLYTFNARHARQPEKACAVEQLNAALEQWHTAWLADERMLQQGAWSSWALVHVVRLHFAYFHTLAMANPKVPSHDEAIRSRLEQATLDDHAASETLGGMPPSLLEGARTVFTAAARTRNGDLAWLMESLRFVLPAVLIVLQATIEDPHATQARDDLERADTWIEVLRLLRSQDSGSDPDKESGVAAHLRALAERAIQNQGA